MHFITVCFHIYINARAFAHLPECSFLFLIRTSIHTHTHHLSICLVFVRVKLIFHAKAMKCEIKKLHFTGSEKLTIGKSVEMTHHRAQALFHRLQNIFSLLLRATKVNPFCNTMSSIHDLFRCTFSNTALTAKNLTLIEYLILYRI